MPRTNAPARGDHPGPFAPQRGDGAAIGARLDRRGLRRPRERGYDILVAVMLSKTYQAFRAAGAPDDKAREAAEEIAGFENRLPRLEAMLALVLAGVASLVVKTFFSS